MALALIMLASNPFLQQTQRQLEPTLRQTDEQRWNASIWRRARGQSVTVRHRHVVWSQYTTNIHCWPRGASQAVGRPVRALSPRRQGSSSSKHVARTESVWVTDCVSSLNARWLATQWPRPRPHWCVRKDGINACLPAPPGSTIGPHTSIYAATPRDSIRRAHAAVNDRSHKLPNAHWPATSAPAGLQSILLRTTAIAASPTDRPMGAI